MNLELDQRKRLTDYLLGNLPEPERLELAARYFEDDELFDQLLEVEDDLLSCYVRGQLEQADRIRFESYLRQLPEGRRKVVTATALAEISAARPAAAHLDSPVRGWLHRLRDALSPTAQFAFRYAPIGIAMLILIGAATWLLIDRRKLQGRNSNLQARIMDYESRQSSMQDQIQSLAQEKQAQSARLQQMQSDLSKIERLREGEARQGARFQSTAAAIATVLLPSLDLRRTGGEPVQVELSLEPHHRLARFTTAIRGVARNAQYRAELHAGNGEVVWRQELRASRPSSSSLSFHIPTELFKQSNYIFKLTLITPNGIDLTREFNITITKK